MKDEQTELLEYKGRRYIIKKFTPDIAGFWAIRVLGKAINSIDDFKFNMKMIGKMIEQFSQMPFDDYKLFQKNCLQSVYVQHETGEYPVIHPDGSWRLMELESDWTTVLLLQTKSFSFSMKDFLDPALWTALTGQNFTALTGPDTTQEAQQTPSPN